MYLPRPDPDEPVRWPNRSQDDYGDDYGDDHRRPTRPRRGPPNDEFTAADWILCVLCSGIGCIIGLVWLSQGNPKGGKMLGMSLLFAVMWAVVRFLIVTSMRSPY